MGNVLSKEAEAAFPITCDQCGAGIQSETNSHGTERRSFQCDREFWFETKFSSGFAETKEIRPCRKSAEGLRTEIRQRADSALYEFGRRLANVPRPEMRAPFDALFVEVRAVTDAWAERNGLLKDGKWRDYTDHV